MFVAASVASAGKTGGSCCRKPFTATAGRENGDGVAFEGGSLASSLVVRIELTNLVRLITINIVV